MSQYLDGESVAAFAEIRIHFLARVLATRH